MGHNGEKRPERGDYLTHKQVQALAALLTQPTKEKAAQAAGIGLTTLKRYLDDPEFQEEYQKAVSDLVEDAATAAKQSLAPALSCLREIVEREDASDANRIAASSKLIEYGLKLIETFDILRKIDELEKWRDETDGKR